MTCLAFSRTIHNDWSIDNWDTKWNSYGYENFPEFPGGSEIIFYTAWSQPYSVISHLSEMFPDAQFQHAWADEDFGVNIGEILHQNGEELEHDEPSPYSKEAYEMAAEIMGVELDEMGYTYSEAEGNYILNYDEENEGMELQ